MQPFRHRLRGTTFVEALITFLVLSLGLLAVSRVQGQLRLHGETARQRSEAVRLAQEDLEQLRSFTSIAPSGTARSYAEVVGTTRTLDSASGYATSNTAYALTRQVTLANGLAAKNVVVTVNWTDRAGEAQRIALASVIAANDPALAGALGVAPAATTLNGPMARVAGIPLSATNLGGGRSAYVPGGGSRGVAFVFDNGSGVVTERCQVDLGAATARLTSANLNGCVRMIANLLSGVVRFTATAATDQAEPPLHAVVALSVTGATYPALPECYTEAVTAAGDRYLAYSCIVYPRANGSWSGQSRLVPEGWTLGTRAADRRICPYRAASSGSSAPAGDGLGRYTDVPGSLVNENFRVIPGNLPCSA